MNADKLKRTLKKEFTKNPAKTFALIAMCPVALYFCLPLVWKGLPRGGSSRGAQEPRFVAAAAAGTAEPDARASVRGNEARHDWKELVRWMERDPYMAAATIPPDTRSPFQTDPHQLELAAAQAELQEQKSAGDIQSSPHELGLVLTATMVGPSVRLATISGKTYREQSLVIAGAQNQAGGPGPRESGQVTFTLSQVESRFVVLERDDKQYRLQLEGTQLAGGDVVIVHENTR